MSAEFDARRAKPADYARERADALAAARRGRAAPPATPPGFDARTAGRAEYAASKAGILAAARRPR